MSRNNVDEMNPSERIDGNAPCVLESDNSGETATYTMGNRVFIVKPQYKENGGDTLVNILVKMMKSDRAKA